MSERKVLNKYYPADYDPSKIPKANRPKNRQWTIRTMAPFNMRCNTCGEYIYKGKKFNSRQELAEGETYLGLKIFRFYIKCPKCVAEISFKTDPENVDYALESGATRNFEALRTAELMAVKEAKEKEEELANNPMKMLENRTKASQREMDMLETLEDLKQVNAKHNKVNTEDMILKYRVYEEKLQQLQDEEDEAFVQSVFGKSGDRVVKRLADDSGDDEDIKDNDKPGPSKMAKPGPSKMEKPGPSKIEKPGPSKMAKFSNPTDFLTQDSASIKKANPLPNPEVSSSEAKLTITTSKKSMPNTKGKSIGLLSKSSKSSLSMLVKKKDPLAKTENTVVKSGEVDSRKSKPENDTLTSTDNTNKKENSVTSASNVALTSNKMTGGLCMLGDYSDTDSNGSSD